MTWATAAGVGGVSAAVVVIAVLIAWLVRTCLALGRDANESRSAQLDAEHFKREAENERDNALVKIAKAEEERDEARRAVSAARAAAVEVIERRKEELQEQIDAGKDDDLVALSRRVFGNGALSKAGDPAPSSDSGEATTVSDRRTTI